MKLINAKSKIRERTFFPKIRKSKFFQDLPKHLGTKKRGIDTEYDWIERMEEIFVYKLRQSISDDKLEIDANILGTIEAW